MSNLFHGCWRKYSWNNGKLNEDHRILRVQSPSSSSKRPISHFIDGKGKMISQEKEKECLLCVSSL